MRSEFVLKGLIILDPEIKRQRHSEIPTNK